MTGIVLMAILVAALVGQAAWLASDMLRGGDADETSIGRRLESYTLISWNNLGTEPRSILRRTRFSRFPRFERLLGRLNLGESLSRDLNRAGLSFRPGEFLFAQLLSTTLAGFAAFLLLPTLFGGVLPAALAGVLGFGAPLFWLRHRGGKRLSQLEVALPDALDLVASSMRAGYGLADGLDLVASENNGPCAEEFGQVLQEIRVGADMDAALARLNERVVSEDLRLLATAIAVQRRTGGNLVEVLQQLARTLRERQRLTAEVHVLTTMPRVSGYIVGAMPLAMLGMMFVTSRDSFDMLIHEPVGQMVLAVSAGLVGIGLLLNNRIASVEM